jgi:mannose-6-phosphate isomerase-like protein (cupin superfamily)
MNVKRVVKELRKKYPGKKVFVTDPENPGEVICEIKPGKEKSEAVAVIDFTKPHYHKRLTEVYKVTKGELEMLIDGRKKVIKKGKSVTLKPGTKHGAKGNETWIRVTSIPGWTPKDHILVE